MSCPQVFHRWHSKCVVLKLQPLIFFNHSILLFLCPKYRYQLSVKSSLWSLSADYLCMKFIKQEPLKNLHHKINFIFQFEIKTCSHKLMHKKQIVKSFLNNITVKWLETTMNSRRQLVNCGLARFSNWKCEAEIIFS